MKQVLFLVAVTLFFLSGCKKESLSSKSETLEKSSYAIGLQVGQSFKQQGIEVDKESLILGMTDALDGKKEQLTKEEVQKALMEMQMEMRKKRENQFKPNKDQAEKFLKENESKPNVKKTQSGLQYLIEKEGSGKKVSKDSFVKIKYKGSLMDGTVFDDTTASGSKDGTISLKPSQLMPGMSEALQLLSVGTKAKVWVHPSLGYGLNVRPKVPPNSLLEYEIEVLESN